MCCSLFFDYFDTNLIKINAILIFDLIINSRINVALLRFELIRLLFDILDACMDTIHYCDFYVKKGYCSRSKEDLIGDYMHRNCPLSCKFCKTG